MELILFLINNLDVFAWSPCEALGVDLEFICHRLNVDPQCPPKKKRPRRSSDVHAGAMKEEVDRLKEAGAIKKVYYPEWIISVVVRKKNGKWRVCVDFTNLNKAYPKDYFQVPKIDQLVDATFGHPRMSFFYTFQGYH